LQQQDMRRGNQPWYYYGLLLSVYEFLPLLLSLIAIPRYMLRKGDMFGRFLVVWAVGALVAYSYAGEKMPWLSLRFGLPLVLLAGRLLGEFLPWLVGSGAGSQRPLALRWTGILSVLVLIGLGTLTVRAAYMAAFVHSDEPKELLIYTQTSRHVPNLAHRIVQIARDSGKGRAIPIIVDGFRESSWPWAWYLRHYTQVAYPDRLNSKSLPAELPPVILVNLNNAAEIEPRLIGYT